MEQRRVFLFVALSMAMFVGWMSIGPKLLPGLFPPTPRHQANKANQTPPDKPGDKSDAEKAAFSRPVIAPKPILVALPAKAATLKSFPNRIVSLGSTDSNTGYFFSVETTSHGASINAIRLSDPRYRELTDRSVPLNLVGNTPSVAGTFQTAIDSIDAQLKKQGTSLGELDWEVVGTTADTEHPGVLSGVEFRTVSPDGALEVRKRFRIRRIEKTGEELVAARDIDSAGYQIDFDLAIKNLGTEARQIHYVLQGPVGLPLENAEHAQLFRELKMGFFDPEEKDLDPAERGLNTSSLTAANLVKAADAETVEEWKSPIKYIGVGTQFFAVLLLPNGDQAKSNYIAVAKPMVVKRATPTSHSDVSVQLTSTMIPLPAGDEVTHSYTLYAGPKRELLLADPSVRATAILDYGWFSPVTKAMLWLMSAFHGWGVPYGIAIVMLTLMVRGGMYPLSVKQAKGAKKMKELQPKIAELKKKYGKDKEKMARAQMELFSKNQYNPLAGCLPVLFQFPIFIGLYAALRSAVDLRMAPFLWFDNLAAPDALFRMPFQLPFLGHDFNLLPLLTVGLFVVQQKMFMPPAVDEQQQMQQKMMSFMMIFMGFLFYHVPAGLCVYFIASSLWGLGERKLLDLKKEEPQTEPTPETAQTKRKPSPVSEKPEKKSGGLWDRLVAAAEANRTANSTAGSNKEAGSKSNGSARANGSKKRRKTKRPRR